MKVEFSLSIYQMKNSFIVSMLVPHSSGLKGGSKF